MVAEVSLEEAPSLSPPPLCAIAPSAAGLLPPIASCRQARVRKGALVRGARAFEKKPREGLKLLQEEGVFRSGRLEAREVAAFLRMAPGLDKASVGGYLGEAGVASNSGDVYFNSGGSGGDGRSAAEAGEGIDRGPSTPMAAVVGVAVDAHDFDAEINIAPGLAFSRDGDRIASESGGGRGGGAGGAGGGGGGVYGGDTVEFHAEVLEAFVDSFDFRGQGLLASLRMFLEAFRLPGEAQQIDRILHVSGGSEIVHTVREECLVDD